ncbi:hypothetical protein RFI_08167 [Reticulomyxa filosa]|uniref:Mitochondrial carrier protein n=1 Tax=Reticulomyxa filosa TaxID=46433 RepID=X6NRQ3_RETFI|nr:hypothetical protein RFI_08167 [Reticulomyxa filosa]|eukprot:ETO28960.1 hypothetical protein RFI_08167 [Reticulomyxa filosa]
MQIKACRYDNVCHCAMETFKKDGYLSFYRSYPATVLLNIPVFVTNFITYETSKLILTNSLGQSDSVWYVHLISGALAGGLAGLVSNPLDVIKTTIQTDPKCGYLSIPLTVNRLLHYNQSLGYTVLMSGASARVLYMIPSAAITWTTYEGVKPNNATFGQIKKGLQLNCFSCFLFCLGLKNSLTANHFKKTFLLEIILLTFCERNFRKFVPKIKKFIILISFCLYIKQFLYYKSIPCDRHAVIFAHSRSQQHPYFLLLCFIFMLLKSESVQYQHSKVKKTKVDRLKKRGNDEKLQRKYFVKKG